MNNRSKYLLKNTAAMALGKVGTKLISFFLVPLYTYVLTKEEYGTVDLIATVCTVLAPVLILNVNEAVMRFCLDRNVDNQKVMSTGLAVLAGATVVGLGIIPAAHCIPKISDYALPVYFYVISMGYAQVFLNYLRGQEKLTAYSVGSILQTGVAACMNILFLVVFRWGIRGYLLAYICANVVCAVYSAILGRVDKVIRAFRPERGLTRMMLRFSVILIPNTFMWWIINSSDRVMVAAMVGTAANGIYAVSYKIPSLLSTVSEIFNQAWSFSAIREMGSEDETQYHNQTYHRMVQVMTLVTAAILLVIKPVMRVYVAAEYYSAWRYTPYLLMGFLFLTLATFLSTAYVMNKNSMGFLLSSMMGAAVNIVLNLLLIPRLGVTGAALATGLSYTSVYLFRGIHTRKYIHIRVFQTGHLIGYGLLIGMCGALFIKGIAGVLLLVALFGAVVLHNRSFFREMWTAVRKRRAGK